MMHKTSPTEMIVFLSECIASVISASFSTVFEKKSDQK